MFEVSSLMAFSHYSAGPADAPGPIISTTFKPGAASAPPGDLLVKKCISCAKDIPDTAFHCVFCGSKQGQPQTAGPAQKTIMGYAAADLAKLLPQQQGGGAPQGGYVPAGTDQRT